MISSSYFVFMPYNQRKLEDAWMQMNFENQLCLVFVKTVLRPHLLNHLGMEVNYWFSWMSTFRQPWKCPNLLRRSLQFKGNLSTCIFHRGIKHCKNYCPKSFVNDPLKKAWKNGSALAVYTPGRATVNNSVFFEDLLTVLPLIIPAL